MGLFNKEEKKVSPGTPTSQVLDLRKQKLSDNQIIQNLQRDGFTSEQIFNAMSQADIKGGIETAPNIPSDLPPPMPETPAPPSIEQPPMPPSPAPISNSPSPIPPMPEPKQGINVDKVEEIVESIIDEKWDELVTSVNKIIEWKNSMDSKISDIQEKSDRIQEKFDKLHKSLISKVDDYDKNMDNVGAELKAMNQVFQKVLPTFTENVQTLSRITEKLSSKKLKK